MNYVENFLESLKQAPSQEMQHQTHISSRVIELADQIKAWHDMRPVPERWHPVQLGRLAAQFNASREITAAALEYAGWLENRIGRYSYWKPRN